MKFRNSLMFGAAIGALVTTGAFAQSKGPSTTTEPYVLPATAGARTVSLLTVGDSVGGYRMTGLPDGMGIWETAGHSFNLVLNHEIGKSLGVSRAHRSTGAFVSRWVINSTTGRVQAGRDHHTAPTDVFTWNGASYVQGTTAYDRLCSADLAARSAFFVAGGGFRYGTQNRIFLSGEETTPPASADHGRVFAHIVTGSETNRSYELPRLGRMAFENALASPYPQIRTVVALMDDAGRETDVTKDKVCRALGQTNCTEAPSELYFYIGTKKGERVFGVSGPAMKDIERAGLTNGFLYGLRVRKTTGEIVSGENKDFAFNAAAPALRTGRFELVNLGDVSKKTGVQIEDDSITQQVTQFIRVEDGAWDPRPGKQNDFYFVTTGRLSSDPAAWRPSRLWRVRFDNIANPQAGGRIDMLLTSSFYANAGTTPDNDPGFQMFDNMTMDRYGRIILQEDTGGNNRLARIYAYGVDSGKLVLVARHNAKFFSGDATTNPTFKTNDEESSGIVDAADIIAPGWFTLTSQAHRSLSDPALVEDGQLLGLYIDPRIAR